MIKKHGHKKNRCSEQNKTEEGKRNNIFSSTCNHCSKVEHKSANCLEHEVIKDQRPQNWKKKEDMEEEASNVEVLLGCIETSAIKSKTDKVLFETEL